MTNSTQSVKSLPPELVRIFNVLNSLLQPNSDETAALDGDVYARLDRWKDGAWVVFISIGQDTWGGTEETWYVSAGTVKPHVVGDVWYRLCWDWINLH